jgi:uncharacterized OB-fold protein
MDDYDELNEDALEGLQRVSSLYAKCPCGYGSVPPCCSCKKCGWTAPAWEIVHADDPRAKP